MVAAVAALAASGLIVTNVVGVTMLNQYLVGRVDDQLRAASQFIRPPDGGAGRPCPTGFRPAGISMLFDSTGVLVQMNDGCSSTATPDVGTPTEVVGHGTNQHPYTVDN